MTRLTKATAIDVSFNCLYDIALPPNKACKGFYFKYNRAVMMPYPGDTHKSIVTSSNGDYNENIRNVGRVMRYKVFDDPAMLQYVMTEDDTQAIARITMPRRAVISAKRRMARIPATSISTTSM